MDEFHFAQPLWLLLGLIPLFIIALTYHQATRFKRIENFAAAHLLPYLLVKKSPTAQAHSWLWYWTGLWLLGVLALAGPRWDYAMQDVFRQRASLLIILDLSESMRVRDLPGDESRFERALQEIEDILREPSELEIGVVVFAGLAHLVSPLSDDYNTIRHLLYNLDIDALPVQGSRVGLALEQASAWLSGAAEYQHVLLISDGDFSELDFANGLTEIKKVPAQVHTLGIGTPEGDLIPSSRGQQGWLRDEKGEPVLSALNEFYLKQLASSGGGIYQLSSFHTRESEVLLQRVRTSTAPDAQRQEQQKLWHERFYILVVIIMLFLLPWYRRTAS
jgi:Ca-activated chloride channel homolog